MSNEINHPLGAFPPPGRENEIGKTAEEIEEEIEELRGSKKKVYVVLKSQDPYDAVEEIRVFTDHDKAITVAGTDGCGGDLYEVELED